MSGSLNLSDLRSASPSQLMEMGQKSGLENLGRSRKHEIMFALLKAAAKKGDWVLIAEKQIEIAGHILSLDEYELALEPNDPVSTASLRSNESVVVLDLEITPALEAEGAARDLIRTIQQARKDADLEVTDRIEVEVSWSPADVEGIKAHEAVIMAAVLAHRISWLPGKPQPEVKLIVS